MCGVGRLPTHLACTTQFIICIYTQKDGTDPPTTKTLTLPGTYPNQQKNKKGTDHAGIATQSVVEKKLQKEQGVSRCVWWYDTLCVCVKS
jgi:hypothetical protein